MTQKTHTITTQVLEQVGAERSSQLIRGYDADHDDKHGHADLTKEAVYRLSHMGEVSSPAAVRHELIVGAALLVAAIETLDRQVGVPSDS